MLQPPSFRSRLHNSPSSAAAASLFTLHMHDWCLHCDRSAAAITVATPLPHHLVVVVVLLALLLCSDLIISPGFAGLLTAICRHQLEDTDHATLFRRRTPLSFSVFSGCSRSRCNPSVSMLSVDSTAEIQWLFKCPGERFCLLIQVPPPPTHHPLLTPPTPYICVSAPGPLFTTSLARAMCYTSPLM